MYVLTQANEIVVPIIIMAYMAEGSLLDISDLSVLRDLLVSHGWTWITAVSTMLFSLMHWPCSTTCLTIKKETQSVKWTIASFLVPTVTGIVVCFLFTTAARAFFKENRGRGRSHVSNHMVCGLCFCLNAVLP